MKIVIAGANGFIGKELIAQWHKAHEIHVLVRQKSAGLSLVHQHLWDGKTLGEWKKVLEETDVLINLAGKSVNCRYHEKNKQAIFASRLESTEILGKAIEQTKVKPRIWINATSGTIYQHEENIPMTEQNGILGSGFSVEVCKQWEACFFQFQFSGVRQIALRTSFVLNEKAGVLVPFLRLAKLGLGGKQASGNQLISWISSEDFSRAILFLIEQESVSGIVNLATPNPVKNGEFMKQVRLFVGRKIGIQAPKWILEIGAFLIRTETELIVKSRFVYPEKLEKLGFTWNDLTLDDFFLNRNRLPISGNSKTTE